MSVSSIQGLTSSSYITEQAKRKKSQQYENISTRNRGADTVSLSEEALALMQNNTSSSTKKNSSEIPQKLQTTDAKSNAKNTRQSSSLSKKSIFSLLLESLFLNDLAENGSFSNQASKASSTEETKTTTPVEPENQQKVSPVKKSEGSEDIAKLLNKAAMGKVSIEDILVVTGSAGKGTSSQAESLARSKSDAKVLNKVAM